MKDPLEIVTGKEEDHIPVETDRYILENFMRANVGLEPLEDPEEEKWEEEVPDIAPTDVVTRMRRFSLVSQSKPQEIAMLDQELRRELKKHDSVMVNHAKILTYASMSRGILTVEDVEKIVYEFKYCCSAYRSGLLKIPEEEYNNLMDHQRLAEAFLAFLKIASGEV